MGDNKSAKAEAEPFTYLHLKKINEFASFLLVVVLLYFAQKFFICKDVQLNMGGQ